MNRGAEANIYHINSSLFPIC